MGRSIVFMLFVLVCMHKLKAQELSSDTLQVQPAVVPNLVPHSEFDINDSEFLIPKSQLTVPEFDFRYKEPKKTIIRQSSPYIVSAGLMAMSLVALSESDDRDNDALNKYNINERIRSRLPDDFRTHVDDYLQYTPLAITAGLKIAGIQGKNDNINSLILASKAHLLNGVIVTTMKKCISMERPDGSGFNSFPSGHTSTAFVNATIMHKEFGHISPWYSVGAYTMAAGTGYLRMMNNKHWLPDVLAGAAIGIATTQLVYATHKYRWGKMPENLIVSPTYSQKRVGFAMAYTF